MGEPPDGPCYFCDADCSGVDDYCWGCNELICPDCSKNESMMGGHDPDDHLIEEEEE